MNFVKLFILQFKYADNTVLVAETANHLQSALNVHVYYCDGFKLILNTSKSKVLVFFKSIQRRYDFQLKNEIIDTVSEYKYLVMLFSRSGSFYKPKQEITKQDTTAMYILSNQKNEIIMLTT